MTLCKYDRAQNFAFLIKTLRYSNADSLQILQTRPSLCQLFQHPFGQEPLAVKCPTWHDKLNGSPINRPNSEKQCLKAFF